MSAFTEARREVMQLMAAVRIGMAFVAAVTVLIEVAERPRLVAVAMLFRTRPSVLPPALMATLTVFALKREIPSKVALVAMRLIWETRAENSVW
jgi:hypothetical protein